MAVLIQRLVDADAAGVAFTANPITGDRDQVIVSAVRGMGERLGRRRDSRRVDRAWRRRRMRARTRARVDEDTVRMIADTRPRR